MKYIFSTLILCTVMTMLEAQTKVQKEVEAAVEKLRLAMISAKKADLESVAGDKLSYGHSSGKVETKAQFVENIVNGNSVFETLEFTDQTIDITGNTAIVRHKLFANTNDKGKGKGTVSLTIMLVWVKEKSDWKMIARQAIKI